MEYTTNYHLPQWVKTDRIMMDDFNAAMAGIDAGIAEAKEIADEAAVPAYVVGDYVGNGEIFRSLPLPFKPQAFIVVLWKGSGETEVKPQKTWAFALRNRGGFGVIIAGESIILSNGQTADGFNQAGCTYTYIAFR